MRQRAVFLDRDGVINQAIVREGKPYPPSNAAETVIFSDAAEALALLKKIGFLLVVVTNQPDVRRGTATREQVEEIHRFLSERLPLDDFFACYHDDQDRCNCRKPLPGLLFEAAHQYDIDVKHSYLVGDRWRDIEAGSAAGCKTIFIDRRYNERSATVEPEAKVSSLRDAAHWIVKQEAENT